MLLTVRKRQAATLLSCLLMCKLAAAQADDPAAAPKPQVVTITGNFSTDLRPYSWYLPGLREFRQYRRLAPHAALRFGLVSASTGKPLPLLQARLEKRDLWKEWIQDLPVDQEGWFTLPESEEAERRNANVMISRRSSANVSWMIDVQTPGLPPRTYRLGDLRLECRVYLAIEWDKWRGAKVMGQEAHGVRTPPMDAACGGPRWIFLNTRPWPRLESYLLRDGERRIGYEVKGWPISAKSLPLELAQDEGSPPWSDDTLVEFVFRDNSRWQAVKAVTP
jgi:hypothetical protein